MSAKDSHLEDEFQRHKIATKTLDTVMQTMDDKVRLAEELLKLL